MFEPIVPPLRDHLWDCTKETFKATWTFRGGLDKGMNFSSYNTAGVMEELGIFEIHKILTEKNV